MPHIRVCLGKHDFWLASCEGLTIAGTVNLIPLINDTGHISPIIRTAGGEGISVSLHAAMRDIDVHVLPRLIKTVRLAKLATIRQRRRNVLNTGRT